MKNPLGKIAKEQDGYKVVFERVLNHPIEKVWNAITSTEELKFWFTDIEMDSRPGGTITFHFRDKDGTKSYGEIIAIEPPHRFVWTWEGELAVWELAVLDKHTTRLIFTYSKMTEDYAINAPAGFHDLLDLLEERLGGSEKISPFGAEDYGPEQFKTPVHYAAAFYETYPKHVKNPPVVVEKTLHSPVERVWRAITDKEQLKQWYFDLDDFKPEIGFCFSFAGQGHQGAQYIHRCTVTEVVPQKKLQYSWQYEGHPGYSLVTFELAEMENETKLTVTHHGLETFPQDSPDFAWKSFYGGWNEIIGTMLPEFLDKGNGDGKEPSLLIVRRFDVAPEVVFDAFTKPEAMRIWWTDDTTFDIDLRVGGRWVITRKEGETGYTATGEYLEIERPYRLMYTYAMPQFSLNSDTITIDIAPDGKGDCEVTFVQHGEDIAAELQELQPGEVSESEKGWQQGFDLMEAAWGTKITPVVECQMMISKPVEAVFQAFIDPAITIKFWFTKSSGKLETGKTVTWEWEMYNVSSDVLVKEIVPGQKISIEWGNTPMTTVDFEFTALTADTTYVVIKNYGFHQTGDDLIQAINDNTGGFTTVLDGLKAWLEFGIELNLVRDKFPNKRQK